MLKKCTCLQRASVLILGLLILCTVTAFLGVRAAHELYLPLDTPPLTEDFTAAQPDIVSCTRTDGGIRLSFLAPGQTEIVAGDMLLAVVTCSPGGFMFDNISGLYTGYVWVKAAVLAFLTGTAIILLASLRQQRRTAFYHYATPLMIAFTLLNVLILAWVVISSLTLPHTTL